MKKLVVLLFNVIRKIGTPGLLVLEIITLTSLNCNSASIVRFENKQEAEVLQLINNHLTDVDLKTNNALQQVIKNVGIQAKEHFGDQELNSQLIESVSDKVFNSLNDSKANNAVGLEVLKDINNFRTFVAILVHRYTRTLGQFVGKFNKKIFNHPSEKTGLTNVLQNLVKQYLTNKFDLSDILTDTINVGMMSTVENIVFSPNGKYFACIDSVKQVVKVFDLNTHIVISAIDSGYNFDGEFNFNKIAFTPDSKKIAAGLSNGTVRIYDLNTNDYYTLDTNQNEFVVSLTFSSNGKYLAVSSNSNLVIFDLTARGIMNIINGNNSGSVCITADNQYVAIASGKAVNLFDLNTNQIVHTFNLDFAAQGVAFDSSGRYLKIVSFNDQTKIIKIDIFDINTKLSLENSFECVYKGAKGYLEVCFCSDEKYILIRDSNYIGSILDLKSKKFIKEIKKDFGHGKYYSFSCDGKYLAIGSGSSIKISILSDNDVIKTLTFKQLKLLHDLAQAKKVAKNVRIILSQEDQEVFDSLPQLIQNLLKQNLLFVHLQSNLQKAIFNIKRFLNI